MYLTQFDKNTYIHACDVIGVQEVTDAHRHGDEEIEPIVILTLLNGTSCAVRTPLKVVLMTVEEAMENHSHGEDLE